MTILLALGLATVALVRLGLTPDLTALTAREVTSGTVAPNDSEDPNALLAVRYHLGFEFDPDQALAHYRAALRRAPLRPGLWMGLARLYDDVGNRDAAWRALQMALRVAGPSPSLRWEAATLLLAWGEVEGAVSHLRFVYEVDPDRRDDVLMLGRLVLPPREIAGRLISQRPEALRAYFGLLLSQRNLADARVVWERLTEMNEADLALSRQYSQALIQEREFDEAMIIWRQLYGDGEELVWNGGFQRELVGWGFGWQLRDRSSAQVTLDLAVAYAGGRSLQVRFNGMPATRDVVPVEQLVRVKPGTTYRLKAQARVSELYTRSGLALEVLDGIAGHPLTRTPTLSGTRDWTLLETDFQVPPEVPVVRLRLRRRPSDLFELPIYGTAWIDEVSLHPASMSK